MHSNDYDGSMAILLERRLFDSTVHMITAGLFLFIFGVVVWVLCLSYVSFLVTLIQVLIWN